MAKKTDFEHQSLQDTQSVADYLDTIISGIRSGSLTVSSGEREIDLRPKGLIRFEVRASERSDRHRLTLRLTWNPGSASSSAPEDPLRISVDH